MTSIYSLFIILTSDGNNTYCLSTDPSQIKLPFLKIDNIAYLDDEIRYHVRHFFDTSSFQFNEECDIDVICLQNSFSINYLESIINDYDKNNILLITCGGIMEKNNTKNTHWIKLIYDSDIVGFTRDKNLNLLIDHVINKTLV
jgi:hypothetical protein